MDNETQDQAEMVEKISIAVSRRKALAMAAKLGLGGAALAGGVSSSLADNPPPTAGGLPRKTYKFFFVCHVTLDQFFTPTVYGIQDACALFGCQYQWTGSQKNVVSEMVNAMQTAIAEKADGIAVCLVDPKAFDAPTATAIAAGIPVIAFNADVPSGSPNKRLAYVGQPLYQSGYSAATKWLKLVPKDSHVMLEIGVPGSLNTQPRLDGCIQYIKEQGTRSPTMSSTPAQTRPRRYRGSKATTSATRKWLAYSLRAAQIPTPAASYPPSMASPKRA